MSTIDLIPIDFLNEELLSRIFSIKEKAEVFKLFKDIFSKPRGYATTIFSYLPETNNLRVEQVSALLNKWEDRKLQLEGTTFAVMENGIFYRVLRGKETVYDNTYSVLKEILPEIYNDTRNVDLGNSIVVPLTSQTKVIGALSVSSVGLDQSSIPEVQILGNSISVILNIVYHHLNHVTIEQTLKENEEKLNLTIDNSHDAVMWADPQTGLIVNCNRAAELLLEKKRHEIVGHPITTVHAPEKVEYYLGLFRSVAKGGFMMVDQGVITKSGKIKFVDLSAFPVIVNNRLLFQGIFRDVSEKKKIEEDLRQSEVKYRQLVENAQEGIWAIDNDMKTTFVNPRVAEMLGYTVKEMLGRSIYEFMDKRNIVIAKRKLEQRKRGIRESYELEYIKKDGKKIDTIINVSPILDEKGIFAGVLGFITDVSDKRKMEEEIRSLAKFPDENPNPILRLSQDGIILAANRSSNSLLENWDSKVGDYAPKNWRDITLETIASKSSKTIEVELEGKMLSFFVMPIVEEGYVNLYGRDVSDRKKMEEELRQSENRYRTVFENTGTGMAIIEEDMTMSLVNKEFENLTGYTREEVEAKRKWTDFIIKEDLEKMVKYHFKRRVDRSVVPHNYEFQGVSKQGDVKTVLLNIDVIPGTKKSVASLINITQRKRIEEDLRASEERFRSVVNAAADAIISIDSQEKIVSWNKAAEDTFGYSADEATGKPITLVIPEQSRGLHEIMAGKFRPSTASISKAGSIGSARRKDGSTFPIEASFSKWKEKEEAFFVAVIRDITERLKMEDELRRYAEHLSELVEEKTEELREAERLITMGQVATMVGHDLRNPLQVLVNLAYLIKMEAGKLPSSAGIELQNLLTTVEKQIEYMNKIVSDLQDYGRTLEPHYTRVKLNKLIADSLAKVNAPERVKVLVDIQEKFPSLVVDAFMMERVFTNLINNAIQAMPEGGRLTVSTSVDGDMALICVKDTGVGISEENMGKLFTPLFTTKAKGQGLGLVVCKRLVEAHGGSIYVESEVGVGSTFNVRIPLRKENI